MERDRDCSDPQYGPPEKCLRIAYRARLSELAVATLFRDPDHALAVLKREYPDLAPLYAALYQYATIGDDAKRSGTVEALVEAAQARSGDDDVKAISPEEAASSDKGFSSYFIAASMVGEFIAMPCDALIRRPGLIEALGSHYGGMLDGVMPESDCDAMLPPVPELEQFADSAWQDVGECDGTIRFSVYRDSRKMLTVVRLHRQDIWKDKVSEDLPLTRVAAGAIAVKALTDYYIRTYKLALAVAAADADTAIGVLSGSIYNACKE